ncbi:DUF1829 domain-containing protein [Gluconacetobacter asukensis]|uniref:DUF1829 domain-containing protein n=1 Tax=Gluconacetobacter asukensis TaxID=1017181 RepID=A0A7W4IXR4_9PROT|nr:DUF1829 domain-containing protein [Gluconacetobacter asukensis]MBB2170989.1 DUF1829 domain-containing protein [Gluconacetobacter asukensis]
MSEIDLLIDGYWRWLRDKTAIKQLKDWTEITTPYLDRHNDYLQIYARKTETGFVLTDGGETLLDLKQSGCLMDSQKRQAILQTILNGFGIEQQDTELQVTATSDNFALRKHNLIQAILSVHDMFFLASSTIEALFFEDVADWLESVDIRYTPRVKFSGKSGFDHMFDFVIPKSKVASERIIRAINNPSRSTAQNLIMAWIDTKDSRPESSESFAFLNDNEKTIAGNVTEALRNYGITPVAWSQRDQFRERLVV